jgi:peptidoglycan/LPS O-acetylase OafA/YrhL
MANLDNFAVGMALGVLVGALGSARPLSGGGRLMLRIAALAILSLAVVTRQADAWTGVYFSTVCAIGFGCLVAAAVPGPLHDRWARALSWHPLLWLGVI